MKSIRIKLKFSVFDKFQSEPLNVVHDFDFARYTSVPLIFLVKCQLWTFAAWQK